MIHRPHQTCGLWLLTLFLFSAAKQAGFEEQAKLKNQFRALDDDEIDFLDAVVSRERAKENAVKKETADELESFRKQQQLAEKAPVAADSVNPEAAVPDTWRAKKRRRKDADTAIPKVRKLSDQQSKSPPAAVLGIRTAQPSKEPPVKVQTTAALGLAYGSSDDDDDDEDE